MAIRHASVGIALTIFACAVQAQDVGGTPARIHPGQPRLLPDSQPAPVATAPIAREAAPVRQPEPMPVRQPLVAEPAHVAEKPAGKKNCYYTGSGMRCTK